MTSESDIPQSPNTERAVLSLMAREDEFRRRALAEGLERQHFHAYGPIFDAIVELARSGSLIDDATLSAALEHAGTIDDVGGPATITDLFRDTSNGTGWQRYVRDLRATFALRVKREGLEWAQKALTAGEAMDALQTTQEAMKAALAGPSRSKSAKQVMHDVLSEMERLASAGAIPGIPTGMGDLDAVTGGMKPGQLWTVTAETSRGKSVLMTQLGCAAIKTGRKAAFFSVEMMTAEIGMRMVAHRGGVPMDRLTMPGGATKGDLMRIRTQIELLSQEQFWVDDSPKMTLAHVEREAHRISEENDGLDVVVVDYLQILKGERAKNQNREEAVAYLSSGLKQLAKSLGCPVVTGAQVNNQGKTRESEAIAFDSDVVLGISDDGITLVKARNGERGRVFPYRLNGAIQTFEAFRPDDDPPDQIQEQQADRWAQNKRIGGGRNQQYKS